MTGVEPSEISDTPFDTVLVTQTFREVGFISGFVADPKDWTKRWIVELLIDGWPVDVVRADRFDGRTPDHGQKAQDFGFAFDLRKFNAVRGSVLEIRLANSDVILAQFDVEGPIASTVSASPGAVVWRGGLRFGGWLAEEPSAELEVRGLIDEDLVFEAAMVGVQLVDDGKIRRSRPSFDVHVPARFADGKVHRLHVIDGEGRPLAGSPVSFFAFQDGLAAVLDRRADAPGERIRGTEFDKMFPQSAPFGALDAWIARFFLTPEAMAPTDIALALVGDDEVEASLASLKESPHNWVVGILPSGNAHGRFDGGDLADFLTRDASNCSIVVMAPSGTLFETAAADRLIKALLAAPEADFAYGDTRVRPQAVGRDVLPSAFPAFDYERMLEQGYAAWCFVARTEAIKAAARSGADSLPSLFFKLLGDQGPSGRAPIHVPGFVTTLPRIDVDGATHTLKDAVIAHLTGRGLRAEVRRGQGLAFPSLIVKRAITAETVSVIVPTHNAVDDVRNCIDRLRGLRTRHKLEIFIADMASSEPALLRYFARPEAHAAVQIRVEGPKNVARALNQGAARATGRHLLFLDPYVVLDDPDPLDDLISRCADVTTAAAGPTLVWPGGVVQGAGLVLSHAFGASHVGQGLADADPGYGDLMRIAQERSALSTSCVLVKREDHVALRGFDEAFGRGYFAVDYGLRLRERGRRIVFSPHARATCIRSVSFAEALEPENVGALALRRELEHLRLRWGDRLNQDPFYSPLLALNGDLFSALAWPPRLVENPPPDRPQVNWF